tara:strand:- start:744 stop:1052 length:309 start_codon:yes stop_codon:yes gene_type:complete
MGNYLFDQYTFLHFSVGVVVYYWGVSLPTWIIVHVLFEIVENTKIGMLLINKYFVFWPGGKPKADSLTNIIGDNIGAILGWLVARYLDKLGSKLGWYQPHIK